MFKSEGVSVKGHVLTGLCSLLILLVVGNYAAAEMKLKAPLPELCYECHKDLKKELSAPAVHILFKEGKCITCHNSHVSNIIGLMNEDTNYLCLNCHEQLRVLLKSSNIHSPMKDQPCTRCHKPHSSENAHLLTNKEDPLCLECHKDMTEQKQKGFACSPFKEGKCSSCHNSHASQEDYLLISTPNSLCRKCHAPRCRAGNVSIAADVEKSDCVSCHSGHSSKDRGILGPFGHSVFLNKDCGACHDPIRAGGKITTKKPGDELCLSCHKKEEIKYSGADIHVKNAKNSCTICHDHHSSGKKNLTKGETRICLKCHEQTEKNTSNMERAIRAIRCAPIKNRQCFECHKPAHSDRPLYFSTDEFVLCAKCHESQHKITHPQGPDVIDPRNGKPISCISCHSMHNAQADFMLTGDRNRALCIQCHRM